MAKPASAPTPTPATTEKNKNSQQGTSAGGAGDKVDDVISAPPSNGAADDAKVTASNEEDN